MRETVPSFLYSTAVGNVWGCGGSDGGGIAFCSRFARDVMEKADGVLLVMVRKEKRTN
jgi:hypothetical protein